MQVIVDLVHILVPIKLVSQLSSCNMRICIVSTSVLQVSTLVRHQYTVKCRCAILWCNSNVFFPAVFSELSFRFLLRVKKDRMKEELYK